MSERTYNRHEINEATRHTERLVARTVADIVAGAVGVEEIHRALHGVPKSERELFARQLTTLRRLVEKGREQ